MQRQGELRIGNSFKVTFNGGLSLYDKTLIGLNQSPHDGLLNISLDNGGMPCKRQGQSYIFSDSLGSGSITGLFLNYKGSTIFAHGTKLYKQSSNSNPVVIYDGLLNNDVYMFAYNSILYVLDGAKYLQYDGSIVKDVEPYAPRVVMNRTPDGSNSQIDESWNMLGSSFRNTFNGDGTAKDYKLSLTGLDSTTVTCNVGGTEGNGFTVNRTTGIVTFNVAPSKGTNNIEIKAFKTFPGLKDNIVKCKFGEEFSNRMFISGNSSLPNFYFVSGITDSNDITYFPQKYQYTVRGNDKSVTGFKVHYNKLVGFKEDLTFTVENSMLDGNASFPIEYLNTEIGCDIPNSIQLINNNVVFCNSYYGVCVISSSMIPGEKNIFPVSQNINGSYDKPGLLYEPIEQLKKATSVDYDYKYILNVGSKCYVLDYRDVFRIDKPKDNRWFLWDNINASFFDVYNGKAVYGSRIEGRLITFTDVKNDFGQGIKAKWRSKFIDFGYPEWLKKVQEIYYSCNSMLKSDITLKYYSDNGEFIKTITLNKEDLFGYSWDKFSWDNFNFKVETTQPTIKQKVKIKNIIYFQLEISNDKPNEDISITNIIIKYNLTKRVR